MLANAQCNFMPFAYLIRDQCGVSVSPKIGQPQLLHLTDWNCFRRIFRISVGLHH